MSRRTVSGTTQICVVIPSYRAQLSWQQTGQVAAPLTDCVWVICCTWADISQPSCQIAAKLTDHSQADRTHLSWQTAAERTGYKWAERLQLSQLVAAEMATFISGNRVQPSWQFAAELTCCSWADSWVDELQLSLQIAAELSWADNLQLSWLSWQTAAKLTDHDWADRLQLRRQTAEEVALYSSADVLQLVCHSRSIARQNTLE